MLIHLFLNLFASSNTNINTKKVKKSQKEESECSCDTCFEKYQQLWEKREQAWRKKLNLDYQERVDWKRRKGGKRQSEERKQEQSHEGWKLWQARKFFEVFSGKSSTSEMTEEPENSQKLPKNDDYEKEENKLENDD